MNYIFKQPLIWLARYFPSIPRFFGIKILTSGYSDVTPWVSTGNEPKGRGVESKVSYLVKNESNVPIPIKIVMACVQPEDVWAQIYPVDHALQGGWNRDVSCGEEKFDPDLRKKYKSTIIPAYTQVKIDHFATQQPHPSYFSTFSFEIKPDDLSVIVLNKNFFSLKRWQIGDLVIKCLIVIVITAIVLFGALYFWVNFAFPVWKHFFS